MCTLVYIEILVNDQEVKKIFHLIKCCYEVQGTFDFVYCFSNIKSDFEIRLD